MDTILTRVEDAVVYKDDIIIGQSQEELRKRIKILTYHSLVFISG